MHPCPFHTGSKVFGCRFNFFPGSKFHYCNQISLIPGFQLQLPAADRLHIIDVNGFPGSHDFPIPQCVNCWLVSSRKLFQLSAEISNSNRNRNLQYSLDFLADIPQKINQRGLLSLSINCCNQRNSHCWVKCHKPAVILQIIFQKTLYRNRNQFFFLMKRQPRFLWCFVLYINYRSQPFFCP